MSAAGADWPEDFDTIRTGAIARGLGPNPIVYNDAIGGLRAGSPDGTGVSVVCGTGAATGARSRDGRIWHSSFWQVPQGAQQLGHLALQAVIQAELGIAPPTALASALLHHLNAPTIEAALHALTARSLPSRPDVKSLAKLLLDVAATGDSLAVGVVAAHGRALGDVALAAARRVGLVHEPFHLVLIGGVFRHPSPVLREAVVTRVREDAPDVNVIQAALEPAIGAVMLALEHISVAITPEVRANLQATAPPTDVFAT
ncbi:MAG: kinase [Candidatus Roseilinea sp.]|nr:MAG: kinase [Candidatus Roseilinea sp.]